MKIFLQSLHESLASQLNESHELMRLFEVIQARESKLATADEINQIKAFQESDSCKVFSDEVIALVLESKSKKRLKKGINYQPFLYRCNDKNWALFKDILCNYFSQATPFHFDMIVKTYAHCTAVQLDFNGKDFRVYYLDAAGACHNESFLLNLSEFTSFNSVIAQRLDIQRDTRNCAIFSIQHLNNLSYHSLNTEQLPAVFFKHSQRTSFFKSDSFKDQRIHKHNSHTFQDHINQYSIMVEGAAGDDSGVKAQRNYSILFKRHKYLQAAFDELTTLETSMSESEIETMLNARMCFNSKNTASEIALMECSEIEHEPNDTISSKATGTNSCLEFGTSIESGEIEKNIAQTTASPSQFTVENSVSRYTANELCRNKTKNECSVLMVIGGGAVAFTGMMLETFSSSNLTMAIIFFGVVIMATGYVLDKSLPSFSL